MPTSAIKVTSSTDWIDVTPSRLWRLQHSRKALRELVRRLRGNQAPVDQLSRVEAERQAALKLAGRRSARIAVQLAFCINLLCDLRAQGWMLRTTRHSLLALAPTNGLNATDEKARVRAAHIIERDMQLRQPAVLSFIREMERVRLHNGTWCSIFSLMRDGSDLSAKLTDASLCLQGPPREAMLRRAIDPYIQIAQAGIHCTFTGLDLLDVWRYFRHTWTTTYQSAPGRKIFVLVRDRAAANHPVIGIAALGSPIVQLSVRDEWIGWTPTQIIAAIHNAPSAAWIHWLQSSLETLIAGIYADDFVKSTDLRRCDLRCPNPEIIAKLRRLAADERKVHQLYPEQRQHKGATRRPNVNWSTQARTHLFRSKRAAGLADLLQARYLLRRSCIDSPSASIRTRALASDDAKRAIATILRHIKAAHIGVEVMDVTVCGAIAPYNHVLAGKLVSLLMATPEIRREYIRRYRSASSIIASSMAGQPINRPPRLVLLGTTSLYGIAASQYNRLTMAANRAGGRQGTTLEFECLGRTAGYGSYHFSRATIEALEPLLGQLQQGRPVNSIFGEGVNPKLRKVRAALDSVGLPSNLLLQHGSPRLVYGIALARNFREILLGLHARPIYLIPDRPEATAQIVDFWRTRWLSRRVENVEVIRAVKQHSLLHPIQHGARVPVPSRTDETSFIGVDAQRPPASGLANPARADSESPALSGPAAVC
jgi:hypothetical protein